MKKTRWFRGLLAACALAALFPVKAQASAVGTFTYVKGRVDITSPGERARPAHLGDEIQVGDIIRAKSKSRAEVTFVDGSVLRLAENTRVEITSYMVDKEKTDGILNLFRGKIQSIVKKRAGAVFGRKSKNRYEVRTPTAVCGVRGTDFFTWYQKGVSGAAFKEGKGYGYSANRPDVVMEIEAGQAMLVITPDQPPILRPASSLDLQEHLQDTAPEKEAEQEESEGETEAVQEPSQEEPQLEGGEEDVSEPGTKFESMGTTEPELGEPERPSGGTDLVQGVTASENLTPEIPPEIPQEEEDQTRFTGVVTVGFLDEGSLSGSIKNDPAFPATYAGEGQAKLFGLFSGSPSGAYMGTVSGTMDDGSAFEGFMASAIGSCRSTFSQIYLSPEGGVGYLYGSFSGGLDQGTGTMSLSGPAYRSDILGRVEFSLEAGETLSEALSASLFNLDENTLPILGSINAGGNFGPGYFDADIDSKAIYTTSGKMLGVWGSNTWNGSYSNEQEIPSWNGIYGEDGTTSSDDTYYILGSISGTDDLAGHLDVSGTMTYLDSASLGTIYLWNRGVYQLPTSDDLMVDMDYESAGSGTLTLDPLEFKGNWGNPGGTFYYNDSGDMTGGGDDWGLIGGLAAPWDSASGSFFAMGKYSDWGPGGKYLWNSSIGGEGSAGSQGEFSGFTGGFWKPAGSEYGIMDGVAFAIYKDAEGRAGFLVDNSISGLFYPQLEMWTAQGTLSRDVKGSFSGLSLGSTSLAAGMSGSFDDGSYVKGSGHVDTLYYEQEEEDLPWGMFNVKFDGGSSNNEFYTASGETEDLIGTTITFGGASDYNGQENYWLANLVLSSWSDGEITGDLLNGVYLTPNHAGTFSGPFFGINNGEGGYGTWIGQSIGTFQGTPLELSAAWGISSLLYNGDGYVSEASNIFGLIGFPTPPWDSNPRFLAMGKFESDESYGNQDSFLWNAAISKYNDYGAQIHGYTGGFWRKNISNPGGTVDGAAAAIYVSPPDPDTGLSSAGLLSSSLTGDFYGLFFETGIQVGGIWMALGSPASKEMGKDLNPYSDYGIDIDPGSLDARLYGSFAGGSTPNRIYGEQAPDSGDTYYLYWPVEAPLPWGVYNFKLGFGNYYDGRPRDSEGSPVDAAWSAVIGGEGEFDPHALSDDKPGYWLGSIEGTWTKDGEIRGDLEGHYITKTQAGTISGPFFGLNIFSEIEGGHDGTWIGESFGTFEGQPLAFSSEFSTDPEGNSFFTYHLVNGTAYEGELMRRAEEEPPGSYDGDYHYKYFVPDDGPLLYGEKWTEYHNTDGGEFGEIFLPDGAYYYLTATDHPFVPLKRTTKGDWSPGGLYLEVFSSPPGDGTWDRVWYEEWQSNVLAKSGTVSGIMGGTAEPWNASAADPSEIGLMGLYQPTDGDYTRPSLFGGEIEESDITTGGAYHGYLEGVIDDVDGLLYAIYIDESGNGGILKGNFSGSVYPDLGMWDASGSIYPIAMANDLEVLPEDLHSNVEEGFIAGWVASDFGATDSKIESGLLWGNTLSIKGYDDWGVYGFFLGYDNEFINPQGSTSWSAGAGGWAEFGAHPVSGGGTSPDMGVWLSPAINGIFDEQKVSADFSGTFLTYTKYGNMTGEIVGTKDLEKETWLTSGAGYWKETTALKFNGILKGELLNMTEEYQGHWDDGDGGSYYDYTYDAIANAGWSGEYDADTLKTTHIHYHQDGTKEEWTDENGILSYSEGSWSDGPYGSLLDILRNNSPGTTVDSGPHYYLSRGGGAYGLMGGLDDLWSASPSSPAATRLMGDYDPGGWRQGPDLAVFSLEIRSYNPYDGSVTIWDQDTNSQDGAYSGFLGGRAYGEHQAEGTLMALYLDREGNAGILKGDLAFTAYEDIGMWEGAGSLFPIEVIPETGLDAAYLYTQDPVEAPDGLVKGSFEEGSMSSQGGFGDPAGYTFGTIDWLSYNKEKAVLYYPGQIWRLGVSSVTYGGTFDLGGSSNHDYWYRQYSHDDGSKKVQGMYLSSPDAPGSWSDGLISGKGVDAWVNWNDAVTGVSGADLKGTFDPSSNTWQASAMWAFMDTNTFLSLAGTQAGRDKLAQLNIPYIEVGRDTLTGTGGYNNDTTVNMKDTTFFAYSTGAPPRVWASGNVNGTGSDGSLEIGQGIPLQGATIPDLQANFVMRSWDASKWTANIENGTGTVGGHSITFSGAGAGTHPGDRTFSGTASGIADPAPLD
ncbi:MAG: FecR domain-containing protein [Deltaproteobacteria bacterium]|nr:FecR domain-containing protein [Deltaproteobacteria bacterium]MBW2137709.1 FecR domain-containing protein [Deltaproteobacteria bacterium]